MLSNRKLILLFLVLLAAVFGIYQKPKQPDKKVILEVSFDRSIVTAEGQLIKVADAVDGDTVILANGERLRYIGIDTPEEFDQRKPVQCFAHEAAEKNRELVEGKLIKFYKDVNVKDMYDRWLGFVYLEDGTFVNLELVKQGYAFAYPFPPDVSKSAEFQEAENYARTNKLGLWGNECIVYKLKDGRSQTNPAP